MRMPHQPTATLSPSLVHPHRCCPPFLFATFLPSRPCPHARVPLSFPPIIRLPFSPSFFLSVTLFIFSSLFLKHYLAFCVPFFHFPTLASISYYRKPIFSSNLLFDFLAFPSRTFITFIGMCGASVIISLPQWRIYSKQKGRSIYISLLYILAAFLAASHSFLPTCLLSSAIVHFFSDLASSYFSVSHIQCCIVPFHTHLFLQNFNNVVSLPS